MGKRRGAETGRIEKYYKKMQFVLCELHFLCYTWEEINHGGICFFIESLVLIRYNLFNNKRRAET